MAFYIGFGFFIVAMIVLAGFVVRFSIQLNRQQRDPRKRPRPAGRLDAEKRPLSSNGRAAEDRTPPD